MPICFYMYIKDIICKHILWIHTLVGSKISTDNN